jgi:hypothetical protein
MTRISVALALALALAVAQLIPIPHAIVATALATSNHDHGALTLSPGDTGTVTISGLTVKVHFINWEAGDPDPNVEEDWRRIDGVWENPDLPGLNPTIWHSNSTRPWGRLECMQEQIKAERAQLEICTLRPNE